MSIPAFGLGTFRLTDEAVIASVNEALELGYRVIDTAQIYGNEAAIGKALAQCGIPREELFITTKIWTENLGEDKLIPQPAREPAKLGTDYVDLTLIHWPSPGAAVPVAVSMQQLMKAKAQGLTRQIGGIEFHYPVNGAGDCGRWCRKYRHQSDRTLSVSAKPQSG